MKIVSIALFMVASTVSSAQMWDANWIVGEDTTLNNSGGGAQFDFQENSLRLKYIHKKIFHDGSNTSISDRNGNLQFYSNGCVINNRNHLLLQNGSIHEGEYTDAFCKNGSEEIANRGPQSVMALPNLAHDSLYFFISTRMDQTHVPDSLIWVTVTAGKLYYHIVDMSQNQGLGKVTKKFAAMLADTLEEDDLQAIPHANGRDWWLVVPEFYSNCYYIVLLDSEGRSTVKKQCLGTSFGYDSWLGQAIFSPDGRKYVRFHWKYNLNLFDFDRCTGEFSNPNIITFDSLSFARAGCAFSRSSRYLYATTHKQLFQFDMQAPDIAASRTFIAEYDGFNTPFPTRFSMAGLALDGKIYVGCPGTHRHIHVINEPEKAGTACDFRQHAIWLPTWNFWSFPNVVHTRLGPVDGSLCDSLGRDNVPWAYFRWETPDTLNEPFRAAFTDLSAYEPTSWHWDFGDGTTSQDTNATHNFPADGVYHVCLTATNVNGSTTFCRDIGLGTSGVENFSDEAIGAEIFPNPFGSEGFALGIEGYSPRRAALEFFAPSGRLVANFEVTGTITEFAAPPSLPPGLYFFRLTENGQTLAAGKVVRME